ncbi:hypothetical protein [Sporomusa sp. KB1]|uniref:hypothetical protein n=1 Tax=Sporomusa sp. KB1 TaxID=943346 RepID=UPI0011A61F92|nr:hypothetical protein [Sporomusa sp. KB1]TWH46899.1 hypothetical protein Salpa_2922 [Sporomusa sp. KB1]
MNFLRFFVVAALFWAVQCSAVFAQEVVVDGRGISREAAIHDALRQAVEQAVGTLVNSQTLVQNYMVLRDEVYTKSQGFVSDYSVLTEKWLNGEVVVQARVTVDAQPNSNLMTKLQRLKLIDVGLRDPRIGVVITEHYVRPIPDPAAETAIINQLAEAGFRRMVEPGQLARIRHSDAIKAVINQGDALAAVRLLSNEPVDYLIVGEAFAEYAGADSGYNVMSCRARVEARLIKVDTGEIIAAQGFHSGGIDITEFTAAKKSLNNAGKAAGKFFVDKLMAYAANPEKGLQIKVVSANDYAVVNLLGRLLRQQTGITNAFLRDYQQGTAMFDVNYSGSPDVLAEQLAGMTELPVKVIEISNSVIVVSVK